MNTEAPVFMVSGFRSFNNYEVFKAYMDDVMRQKGRPSLLVQGECPTGVDQLAKRWCLENNIECKGFPADWTKGKRAGPERNTTMLKWADVVCCFFHEQSRGTKDVMKKARKADKVLYEIDITEKM
jgi:hypothetical protein